MTYHMLKLVINSIDINDNAPKFTKNFYQVGITSDVEFNEPILESYVTDIDLANNITLSIDHLSFTHNIDQNQSDFNLF